MTERELFERLEKLEKENRRLKRVGTSILLGVASILLLAVARPPAQSQVTDAKQIIARDPASGNRAVLNGEGLTLYDAKGQIRVELKEGKTGPKGMKDFPGDWLKFYDGGGKPAVELTEGDPPADFVQGLTKVQSTANLVLLDYQGKGVSAANLGVGKATGLWLTKTRLKGGTGWPDANDVGAALLIDGGSAGVQVQEHGSTRVGLYSKSGMSGLDVSDAAGYETEIGVTKLKYPPTGETRRTSAASIVMLGKKQHVIWRAP